MTFNQLLQDTDCDCLANTGEKMELVFARKINKPFVTENDFRSHWERGKRSENCESICGFKGISTRACLKIKKKSSSILYKKTE
jgi:hypothetical protein